MMRLVLLALTLCIAVQRPADACCLGCPCTKYKQEAVDVVDEPVLGYTHAVKGAVPAFNRTRIITLLSRGEWTPITEPLGVVESPATRVNPAQPIRFLTATQSVRAKPYAGVTVLVRRIEKHGKDILVEVDTRTFKLAPCPNQRGYACLLPPGSAQLSPLPPPK